MNKIILAGNVGRDPETRHTPSGMAVVNLSLATERRYKGEKETEWHNLTVFGKQGEVIAQYVSKGDKLAVQGRVKTEKWQGKDGQDRQRQVVIVEDFTLMGGGSEVREVPKGNRHMGGQPPVQPDDFNDEIPF